MTAEQTAYIKEFRKTAESYGYDPDQLVKTAYGPGFQAGAYRGILERQSPKSLPAYDESTRAVGATAGVMGALALAAPALSGTASAMGTTAAKLGLRALTAAGTVDAFGRIHSSMNPREGTEAWYMRQAQEKMRQTRLMGEKARNEGVSITIDPEEAKSKAKELWNSAETHLGQIASQTPTLIDRVDRPWLRGAMNTMNYFPIVGNAIDAINNTYINRKNGMGLVESAGKGTYDALPWIRSHR